MLREAIKYFKRTGYPNLPVMMANTWRGLGWGHHARTPSFFTCLFLHTIHFLHLDLKWRSMSSSKYALWLIFRRKWLRRSHRMLSCCSFSNRISNPYNNLETVESSVPRPRDWTGQAVPCVYFLCQFPEGWSVCLSHAASQARGGGIPAVCPSSGFHPWRR